MRGSANFSCGVFSEVRLCVSLERAAFLLMLQVRSWIPRVAPLLKHPSRMYLGFRLRSQCNRKGSTPPTMSVVYGVLIVCGACLAAVGGLIVVQRLVPATIRKANNDVAGFIYAVLGVIYAGLLALVV